jgi:hypothetical protein
MKNQNKIGSFLCSGIPDKELGEIRAGTAPIVFAALAVAAAKLILDGSYCLGYAVGYIQGSFD